MSSPLIAQGYEGPWVTGERAGEAGPWQHGAGVCLALRHAPFGKSTRLLLTHRQA